MALSLSQIPNDAQHLLACDTKECEGICQLYCNDCHLSMCAECRDEHQNSPETKNHDVVPYKDRKRKLPVEKCKIHPSRHIDLLCEECQIPLCSKCTATQEHRGHVFTDLEIVYAEKVSFFQEEIAKILNCYQPSSYEIKDEIVRDIMEIKKIMDDIRKHIMFEARSVIMLVVTVAAYNIEQVDKMEQSLLETLNSQNKSINGYINYLHGLIKTCHDYISPSSIETLTISLKSENFNIRPIPDFSSPVPPVFTAGQYSIENVAKLLGIINVPNTKPEKRKIKPMETVSSQFLPTENRRGVDRKESDVKQNMSLSSVTKIGTYTAPSVANAFHISLYESERFWVSDWSGNLVQTDLQGKELQKIQTNGRCEGYHTVIKDGSLIYTDKENNVIKRIMPDETITEFIRTGDWTPLSICSSKTNGDILVGMAKQGNGKVTRYKQKGLEMQNIQGDYKGQELYSNPHYVIENINNDICVSDKHAVVVVNKLGQHRFSYTGQKSDFEPYGICTDILGHILVCDFKNETVHLLDQDGQFLSLLLTAQEGVEDPRSVCVDDKNHLWVGQCYNNTVSVYKYLQQ